MATRVRNNSTSSTSSVGSDNSDAQLKGGRNMLDTGRNKNLVQRTRDALGDIGNRLKKNSINPGTGKPAVVLAKPALGLQNTGTFAIPTAPAPRGVRKEAKKPQIVRSNSVTVPLQPVGVPPLPNKALKAEVKAKIFTNLHRSQSVKGRSETTGVLKEVNKNVSKVQPASKSKVPVVHSRSDLIAEAKECEAATTIPQPIKNDSTEKPGEEKEIDLVQETVDILPIQPATSETESNVVIEKELDVNGYSCRRFQITDIDASDDGNPMLVTEYISDICEYLFALEKKYPIRIRYLEGRLVNSRMRAVLMDWLVEVHNQFGFTPETLYIAAKTMDRYLQIDRNITRKQLQLVGVTSMYLAAKFEEVCTPTVIDFSAVSDNAFTASEVRRMEDQILKTLGFDLAPPPAVFFLRRFSKAASATVQLHAMAKYIMELSLVDYAVSHVFPSQQAAGALALAMLVMEKKPLSEMWNSTMQHYSKTSLENLKPIITLMSTVVSRAHEEPTKLQAVSNKYSRARVFRISRMPQLSVDEWKDRVLKELKEI